MFEKDGVRKSLAELKRMYNVSFAANTPQELGWFPCAPVPAEPNPREARARAKLLREEAVRNITVQVSSGKVFDGDENSQARMDRAITIAQLAGMSQTMWTLADNSTVQVTLAELQEALIRAGIRQSELWPLPGDDA